MYFSVTVPIQRLNNGEAFTPTDLCLRGTQEYQKVESHNGNQYVLFGRVYGEQETRLNELSEKLENGLQLQGRYLFLKIQPASKKISFWVDKYRLLNSLVCLSEDKLWFGNNPRFIPADQCERDLVAEHSLSEMGAVPYPRTLFKNIRFVTGNGHYQNTLTENDHALTWPKESETPDVDSWISVFRSGVRNILTEFAPEYFRMSGGVDTRLIAFSIPQDLWPNLKAEVLCHPNLEPSEDHDVLGAKLVAQNLGVPLEIIRPPIERYNYVGNANGEILSGLYGGELLGGLVHQFSPIKKVLDFPASDARNLWEEREKLIGERAMQIELFLSSFRSTIYFSCKDNSWSNPWLLNLYCFSPFVEQGLLDLILQTPYEALMNYQVYDRIFKKLMGEKAAWPLTSPITQHHEGYNLFTEGKNPKSFSNYSMTAKELGEKNLNYFLAEFPAIF